MRVLKREKIAVNVIKFLVILYFGISSAFAVEFGPGSTKAVKEKPEAKRQSAQATAYAQLYTGPKLDMVVPVLDPGIPDDPSKWEKKGIWPGLRKAEAVWYAQNLAKEIDALGMFNSVMVVPDGSVSADLYLIGKIIESNGEDLNIELSLYSTTGENLTKKKLQMKARVSPDWYINSRTASMDPFQGSYATIAGKIAESLIKIDKKDQKLRKKNQRYADKGKYKKIKPEKFEETRIVRRALYGQALSKDEFSEVLKEKRGVKRLAYIPDLDQDSWTRVESIISADAKFNMLMDSSYLNLREDMSDSYRLWQKDAYPIAKAQREAKAAANAAMVGAIFGVVAAGALATNSNSVAGQVAATTAAVASVAALSKSFKENAESKQQAAQLNELGNSVSNVLAPRVIAVQDREVELTGSASEQQAQWSKLLKELYEEGMQDFGDLEIVSSS